MIDVSWLNEAQDIILWQSEHSISTQQYQQAFDLTTRMMTDKNRRVDVIRLTPHLHSLQHGYHSFIYGMLTLHEKRKLLVKHQGIIVIVNPGATMKVLLSVLNRLPAAYQMYFVARDLNHAEQIIESHRAGRHKSYRTTGLIA